MKKAVGIMAVLLVVTLVSTIGYSVWQLKNYRQQPVTVQQNTLFTIPVGMHRQALVHQLESQGIVAPSIWLNGLLRLAPQWKNFKAGTYRITPNMTVEQLFNQFYQGREAQFTIRFVEGTRWQEWLATLRQAPLIKHVLTDVDSQQQLALLKLNPYSSAEGWFYPDTYAYTAGTTDLQVLQWAHNKMQATLQRIWSQRDAGLPYQNPYQLLIMASIIEKETGIAQERGEVASVFVNRLKLGMRLQTDPTVIYGMGDRYQGSISRQDLATPTPYNTYIISGLTPTPIAMPSLASLQAAAHPATTNYLYFVATGNGGHTFSTDLTSHNQAVQLYRQTIKQRANNER